MNPEAADHLAELDIRLEAHRAALRERAEEAKGRLDERVDDLEQRAAPEPYTPPAAPGDDDDFASGGQGLPPLDDAPIIATDDDGIPMWDDGA